MKTLIIKLLVFIMLLWLFDFGVGNITENLYFSNDSGTSGAMINHLTKHKYDVYIMGASAAQHGYIPDVIEQEIGMSVYNAGEDATSIFYKYAILQLILKHAKPKVIIWDVLDLDYYYYEEYVKSNLIKPYHRDPVIYELLKELDPINRAVKVSHIYPYNHKIAAIVTESIAGKSPTSRSNRGFLPTHGSIQLDKIGNYDNYVSDYLKSITKREMVTSEKDELVRKYLKLFIEQCRANDIRLIAFTSPRCPANQDLATIPMISGKLVEVLSQYGIIVHHVQPDKYSQLYRTDLFKDLGHLNHDGAQVFSELVAGIVKKELQIQTPALD